MLCAICNGVFLCRRPLVRPEDENWYFLHHESLEALEASASRGCELCLMIRSMLPGQEHEQGDVTVYSRDDRQGPIRYTVLELSSNREQFTTILRLEIPGEPPLNRELILSQKEDSNIQTRLPSPELLNPCLESTLRRVNTWLSVCCCTHKNCNLAEKRSFRTYLRLLEINSNVAIVRLREHADLPAEAPYLTLSHCWGGKKDKCLLKENLQRYKEAILTDSLAQTFQDAIVLVRCLGYHYLWIDSLCIIQDDFQDWKAQAGSMADVYRGALMNIAATAAADNTQGLFGMFQRDPILLRHPYVQFRKTSNPELKQTSDGSKLLWHGQREHSPPPEDLRKSFDYRPFVPGLYAMKELPAWWRHIDHSPLARRAWIVQERALASRVLHFAARQLFWECNQLKTYETCPEHVTLESPGYSNSVRLKSRRINLGWIDLPSETSPTIWNNTARTLETLDYWNRIIGAYSRGELTYESDKLVAIWGLASALQENVEVPYFAGMWAPQLLQQMLWSVSCPTSPPKDRLAPSWCWTSVNGYVRGCTLDGHSTVRRRLAMILELHVWGNIAKAGGSIRMRGSLVPCTLSCVHLGYSGSLCTMRMRNLHGTTSFMEPDMQVDSWPVQFMLANCTFFYLPILLYHKQRKLKEFRVAGLVLASTDTRGVFQRFGIYEFDALLDEDVYARLRGDASGSQENLQPRSPASPAFPMTMEEERKMVDERLYERYEVDAETQGFANFVFSIR